MSAGSITLAAIAERTDVLAVSCGRYDRAGRYPLATLIERHGPAFSIPELLRTDTGKGKAAQGVP